MKGEMHAELWPIIQLGQQARRGSRQKEAAATASLQQQTPHCLIPISSISHGGEKKQPSQGIAFSGSSARTNSRARATRVGGGDIKNGPPHFGANQIFHFLSAPPRMYKHRYVIKVASCVCFARKKPPKRQLFARAKM
jgi:hypothetical protein